jgi:hypothetical protein
MGTGEIFVLLLIVALVFGTSQVAVFWDEETRASWRRSWSRVAAGLITAAVFYLGYLVGVDLSSARGMNLGLVDHFTGLGLVGLAALVYDASDPDSRARSRSLDEKLAVLLVVMLFLGAGAATGFTASRLLGPTSPGG